MSDLTDFFPAAASGGSLVSYDPLTLDKTFNQAGGNTLGIKRGTSAFSFTGDGVFWTYYADQSSGVGTYNGSLPNTTSVYQTIVDITNTGKGGKLFNIISPMLQAGASFTFKITIDGTATLIPISSVSVNYTRYVLGGLIEGRPSGSTSDRAYGPNFTYRSGAYNSYFDTQRNDDGFYSPGFQNLSIPTSPTKVNHIEFKDSCKIEVIYSAINIYYYGATDKYCGAMVLQN